MMLRVGIAAKIVGALILLSGAMIAGMGAMVYIDARDRLVDDGRSELMQDAAIRAAMITEWGRGVQDDLTYQVQSPTVGFALRALSAGLRAAPDTVSLAPDAAPSAYKTAYDRYADDFERFARKGRFLDLLVLDAEGAIVYAMRDTDRLGRPLSDLPTLASGLAAQVLAGAGRGAQLTDFETINGALTGYAGQAIKAADGSVAGALIVQLGTARLSEIIAVGQTADQASKAYVMDAAGHILAGGPDLSGQTKVSEGDVRSAALFGERGTQKLMSDTPSYVAYAPVRIFSKSFAVIIEASETALVADAVALRQATTWRGALLIALAAALAYVASRVLLRPVNRLTLAAQRLRDGDYETRVPSTRSRDELQMMGEALEGLRSKLFEGQQHAVENVRKSAALASTSAAIMMTDSDFNITYLNAAVVEILTNRLDDFRQVDPEFDPNQLVGVNMDRFHKIPEMVRKRLADPKNLPFTTDIAVGKAFVQLQVDAIGGGDDSHSGLVLEWVDVTDLRRNQAVLNAIHLHQAKAEFDTGGRMIGANDIFEKACNTGKAVTIDADFALLDGDEQPLLDDLKRGTARTGVFRHAGSGAVLDGGVFPIRDRNGKTSGVLFIGKDITDAHAAMSRAETFRQEAEAAQRLVVETLSVGMNAISSGDLTHRLNQALGAEYEQLRDDFNHSMDTLSDAIAAVFDETGAMRQETAEIVKAADDMARRTEMQASTLQQTASSLDELTQSVSSTAAGTVRANQLVAEAKSSAQSSGAVVDAAEKAMSEIAASSEEVVEVISLIDDIAFQTNLLALNAGVEAARAGEAGRGFAVVATEVRALAQRCSNAAAQISSLISRSGQHVSHGVELVGKTGAALKEIVGSITEIAGHIDEIARAGEEQSKGLGQINQAVNEIDHNTQQNAAMFEETTSAAHALAQRVEGLVGTIQQFQIEGASSLRDQPASYTDILQLRDRSSPRATGTEGASTTDFSDWREL
ncbi:methyl-accepting chemotaxis protein [Pseudooceanicola sp. MF1-13]|uniref:methyl-accepting chemotaxis protein n=1 Tax=Pseudooceanicola sp. MF1-13 TaxID=3379095 RepID=UPI0038914D47